MVLCAQHGCAVKPQAALVGTRRRHGRPTKAGGEDSMQRQQARALQRETRKPFPAQAPRDSTSPSGNSRRRSAGSGPANQAGLRTCWIRKSVTASARSLLPACAPEVV